MALNLTPFGQQQILSMPGIRPNTTDWGPPDMSQQIQGALASLHKLYTGAEQQQTTKHEQRKSADVLEDIYRNPGRAAAALGQPGGIYGSSGTDTLSGGAPGAAPLRAGGIGAGGPQALKPFQTQDPVAGDLAPHQRAFLNGIAGPESGGKYNIRYTPQGGATFELGDQHPGVFEPTTGGKKSSAAGRYQFTKTTWDSLTGGKVPFTPENQDRMAWQLATRDYGARTGRNLDADLQQEGFSPRIQAVLKPTWAGLAGGNVGRVGSTYQESLDRYNAAGPTVAANAPPVPGNFANTGIAPRDTGAGPVPTVVSGQPAPVVGNPAAAAPQATPAATPGPDQYVPAPEQVRDAQRILSDPQSTPPMKTWASSVLEKAAATTGSVAQADPTQPSPQNPTPITQNSQPLMPVPGVNQPVPQQTPRPPTMAGMPGAVVPGGQPTMQMPPGTNDLAPQPAVMPQPPAAEAPPPAQAPPPAAAPPPTGAPGGGVPPQGPLVPMPGQEQPQQTPQPQQQPQTTGAVGGGGLQLPARAAAAAQRLGIDPAMLSGADPRYLLALAHAVRSGDPGMVQAVTGAMTATQKAQGAGDWKVISDGQGGFIKWNERTGDVDQSGAAATGGQAAQIIKPGDKQLRQDFNIDPNDRRSYQVKRDARGRITDVSPITEERRDPNPIFQQEQQLAKDVESNPEYKVYQAGNQSLSSLKASFNEGSPQGDLASVFQFLKSLDPSSTVSAGEQNMAGKTGGVVDNLWALYAKALGEGGMTPETRRNFYNTAVATVQGKAGQARRAVDTARNKAKAYDLNPDRVATFNELPEDLGRVSKLDKNGKEVFGNKSNADTAKPQGSKPGDTPDKRVDIGGAGGMGSAKGYWTFTDETGKTWTGYTDPVAGTVKVDKR